MPEISLPFPPFSARKIPVDSVTSRCSSTAPKKMPKANYSIHDSILLFLPLIIMGKCHARQLYTGDSPFHSTPLPLPSGAESSPPAYWPLPQTFCFPSTRTAQSSPAFSHLLSLRDFVMAGYRELGRDVFLDLCSY